MIKNAVLVLFAIFAMTITARANTLTWDNGANNMRWDTTSTNWSGTATWDNAAPDNAVFTFTGDGAVTLTEPITAGTVAITSGTYTFSEGTLTINDQLSFASSGFTRFYSVIAGDGSISKSGQTVRLYGDNTYAGGTTISGGRFIPTHTNALGTGTVTHDGGYVWFSYGNGSSATVTNDFVIAGSPAGSGTNGNTPFVIRGNDGDPISATTTVRLTGLISGSAGSNPRAFVTDTAHSGNHRNVLILDNPDNTFEGIIELYRGSLVFTSNGALGNDNNMISHGGHNTDSRFRFGADNIVLAATREVNLSRTADTYIDTQAHTGTIAGAVTGVGTLYKVGSGTLILSGENTYTRGTRVNAGALLLANLGAKPPDGTITVDNGAALGLRVGTELFSLDDVKALHNNTFAGVSMGAAALAGVDTTLGNVEIADALAGTRGIANFGDNTLTLSGDNTYSGATRVHGGTLALSDGGSIANSAVTLDNAAGVTLRLDSDASIGSLAGGGAAGGDVDLQANTLTTGGNNANTTFNGVISGNGSLVKDGAGMLRLGGENSYGGGTTIDGGRILMTNVNALGTGAVTHAGGQMWFSFDNGSAATVANDFVITGGTAGGVGNSTFTIRGTDGGNPSSTTTVRLTGVISGGDANQRAFYTDTAHSGNHHNVLILDNPNNTFEGIIELYRGSLVFTSDGALGNPNNPVYHGGHNENSQFRFGADNIVLAATREINLFRSGSTAVIDVQDFTAAIEGAVYGPGHLRVIGSGTMILKGTMGDFNSDSNNYVYSPNLAKRGGGTLILDQDHDQTLSGTIGDDASNPAAFVKRGDGTLTLSGDNTFTGNVTVEAGVLKLGRNTALGASNTAATKTTVQSGATLDINGQFGGDNAYGVTIAGTGVDGKGALVNNGGQTTGARQTPNITLSADATIGGTGDFAMISPGWAANTLDLNGHTLTKAGTNTFSMANTTVTPGTVHIREGTLSQYRASNAGAAAFILDDTAGASLELNDLSLSVGSLAGGGATGGNVALGSATLTLGALNTSTAYGGAISGSGGLIKTGDGTLTLSGAGTYTGPTAVNNGTLLVSGSLLGTSSVTVSANGTLGGSGSIAAPVTVHGTLSPGMSPGVLTMAELLLESASTTEMEINGLLRGTEYDGVDIVQEDGLTYGGTLALSFGNPSFFAPGTVFDLFDFPGTASGTFTEVTSTGYYDGMWTWDEGDGLFSLEAGWQTLLFSHVTGDLTIVPEPGAWLLLLSALACGLLVRRRR